MSTEPNLQFTVMVVKGDKTVVHEVDSAKMTIKENAIEVRIHDEQQRQEILGSLTDQEGADPTHGGGGLVRCMLKIGEDDVAAPHPDHKKSNEIHRSYRREYRLTRREKEILIKITQAKTNDTIAKELYISKRTVDTHRQNLMSKLDVHNAAGLLKAAFELGLVS